jgi:hypothetical protein
MRHTLQRTRVPFAVSLTLTIGYGILTTLVPTSAISVEDTASPALQAEVRGDHADDVVIQTKAKAISSDAPRSLQ